MKKNIFQILAMVLIVFSMLSCEEQEVSDPISPSTHPKATFTTDFTGSEVTEGDMIEYTITLDKMFDFDVTFDVMIDATSTVDGDDISYPETVTIPAYTNEATVALEIINDGVPEADESLKFKITIDFVGQRYVLDPATVYPELELTVKNVNAPGLTIMMGWDNHDDDWDLLLIDELGAGNDDNCWAGWTGATGANPEIAVLGTEVPDGTYYAELDPWDVVNSTIVFSTTLGFSDGSIQVLDDVTFVEGDAEGYDYGWGFRIVKIVKSGTNFTATLVDGY